MISRFTLLFFVSIAFLIVVDQLYFSDVRSDVDLDSVSEAFIRNGTLGDILTGAGQLTISENDEDLATQEICAGDEILQGFDLAETFRLRFKVVGESLKVNKLTIQLDIPDEKYLRHRSYKRTLAVKTGSYFITSKFYAQKGHAINFTIKPETESKIILSDIIIDGRFGRSDPILLNGKFLQGSAIELHETKSVDILAARYNKPDPLIKGNTAEVKATGIELNGLASSITFRLEEGINPTFYDGVFLGKKNQGICRYEVSRALRPDNEPGFVLPRVDLFVDEKNYDGELGIVSHKTEKGKAWEVPAKLGVSGMKQKYYQTVGLRFHGGVPGRKKDIASFRIYARKEFGKSYLDVEPILGRKRAKDIKTLVLKYTYQAYRPELGKNFNPFNHILALDIADAIGALVPSHGLVELRINNTSLGMYLAMEHLSDRTVRHWLDNDDFLTYYYKKYNPPNISSSFFAIVNQITSKHGEAAFEELDYRYDIENVINSIILSSYIADDDYCQGIEILDKKKELSTVKITSINYDLDHAFIQYKNDKLKVTADRGAYSLITPNKSTACPRRWAYSWVYAESDTFRKLFRERLEELLENELSPDNINAILDNYRKINNEFFLGKHTEALAQLARYAQERPQVLLDTLEKLEEKTRLNNVSITGVDP